MSRDELELTYLDTGVSIGHLLSVLDVVLPDVVPRPVDKAIPDTVLGTVHRTWRLPKS